MTSDDGPGCIAAVGERGVPLWQSARGYADLEARRSITVETTFETASVIKQFTAIGILLLEQSGRLRTSDPLSRHLDGLPGWANRVTLFQMVHHTSGIHDYYPVLDTGGDPTATVDRAEVLRLIADEPRLDFTPGARWGYSNSNYVLVTEVIERVSGQSYPAFLRAQVFEPLGLPLEASDGARTSGLAEPYVRTAGGFGPGGWGFYAMGAIGVRSTASDLVRWADDYRTGTVGGQVVVEDQWRDAPVSTLESARSGAGILRLTDGALYGEGLFGGYRSGFLVSPDRQRSAVLLRNIDDGRDPHTFVRGLGRLWDFA